RSATMAAILLVGIAWAYRSVFAQLAHRWSVDAEYSHGFLVPVFALGLLWARRDKLAFDSWGPSWSALLFLAAGAVWCPCRGLFLLHLVGTSQPPRHAGRGIPGRRRPAGAGLGLAGHPFPGVHDPPPGPCRTHAGEALATNCHAGQHQRSADPGLLRPSGGE